MHDELCAFIQAQPAQPDTLLSEGLYVWRAAERAERSPAVDRTSHQLTRTAVDLMLASPV